MVEDATMVKLHPSEAASYYNALPEAQTSHE